MLRRRDLLALAATVVVAPGRPAPRRVLVLGGTRWIGPHVVAALLARGHAPTLFNRGRTAPDLFPQIETIRGDREGDLSELTGRSWDVVIDLSGTRPGWVRRSARRLAGSVRRYVLMSSTAVYARIEGPAVDESLPLRSPPDEDDPKAMYGPRKAGCEIAAEQELPGRVCSLRASYVVGPGDPFQRAAAWLARFARGGQLRLPGRPQDGLLYVDVRDLAPFVVRVLEHGAVGPFNVTHRTSVGAWAETCRALCDSDVALEWSGAPEPAAPLVEAPRAPYRRWGELSAARALAGGFEPGPLATTLGGAWLAIRDDADALAAGLQAWARVSSP